MRQVVACSGCMFRLKKHSPNKDKMSEPMSSNQQQALPGRPGNLDPGQQHKLSKMRDQVRSGSLK